MARGRHLLEVVALVGAATILIGSCTATGASAPPPVPSYSHGAAWWTWAPASDEDVAMVDRLTAAWTTHDVDAVPSLYAPDAQLVMSWMADPAPYDVVRATIAGNGNSYQRISPVFTVAGEGSTALPGGSRYLFFALVIHDDIFDSWLEVNAQNLIQTHWAGWAK